MSGLRRQWQPLAAIAACSATLFVLLLAADLGASSPGGRHGASPPDPAAGCPDARRGLAWYTRASARWRRQRGAPFPSPLRVRLGCPALRQAADLARARARGERRAFERWFRVTYAKWECVHSREAAWNDPHGPYYGGLQMDVDFQRAYGRGYLARYGLAHRWPVWAQLVAAERAYQSRGWQPWPNTARACGLL